MKLTYDTQQVNDIIALKMTYVASYIQDVMEKNLLSDIEIDHFTDLFNCVLVEDQKDTMIKQIEKKHKKDLKK